MPSPLKSPTATEFGLEPALKLVAAPNEPVLAPSRTETVPELELATTRSCLPSPFRSPIATERGFVPTAKSLCGLKLNVAEAPNGRSAVSTIAAAPIKTKRRRLSHARAALIANTAFISQTS